MGFFGRFFGNEYDRDFGPHREMGGMRDWGYGAGVWGNASQDAGRQEYDRGFHGSGSGYDRGFRGNWQTDYGDPFGDRAARTPMRMMRGHHDPGYDQGFFGFGHDRHLHDHPMPRGERGRSGGHGMQSRGNMERDRWESGAGSWTRGYGRSYDQNFRRGYDGGWF